MQKIRTIIFDLGGVIINLYVEKTIVAFSELSGLSEKEVESAYLSADVFKQYEKGLISDADFRQSLRDQFKLKVSDYEINSAWNAMLGEITAERIESIRYLLQNYKCIVLSNTNAIHERAFHKILSDSFPYQHLKELFHEVYFSHELNQRKPDREIYENVLSLAKTQANEALFMDDGIQNLNSASQLGIHTLHIPRNGGFMHLLENKLSDI
ncbi:putative hydrolase of the HAD superfamily [Marivirga sericea]|uniref:Putative hydrolase of the HAD superfamily n=1 Tax=Marivirga sericea TaxID=1028 RepID=A0A1X7JHU6_9BACT|nr:HAD family phosphatase [Marivirga sericea]SMG27665.1 putative hydrolase of the HAD superfamily [Marivirga sericea]